MNQAKRDELEHQIHCQCGCNLDVYTCRTTDFSCEVSPRDAPRRDGARRRRLLGAGDHRRVHERVRRARADGAAAPAGSTSPRGSRRSSRSRRGSRSCSWCCGAFARPRSRPRSRHRSADATPDRAGAPRRARAQRRSVTPLIVGAVLAVIALVVVLYPLFGDLALPTRRAAHSAKAPRRASRRCRRCARSSSIARPASSPTATMPRSRRATRARRWRPCATRMRASAGPSGDAAEAVILQYRRRQRGCSACGPRPEPDAIYCSTCGRYLAGELRALPRANHRDRRALLRSAAAHRSRPNGEPHARLHGYSSSRSSRRSATLSGTNVHARQSEPASPKPTYMSDRDSAPRRTPRR